MLEQKLFFTRNGEYTTWEKIQSLNGSSAESIIIYLEKELKIEVNEYKKINSSCKGILYKVCTSIVTVAKRYNLSDNGLRKICISMDIPLPPAGYWAKFNAGKPVIKKPELLPLRNNVSINGEYETTTMKGNDIIRYIDTNALSNQELKELDCLDLLTKQSEDKFLSWCHKLSVPKRINNYDSLIIDHQNEMEYRRARDEVHKFKDITQSMFNNSKIKYRNNQPIIPIYVSVNQIDRSYKIMDTFIKAVKELRGRIKVDLYEGNDYAYIELMGYRVSFSLYEIKTKRRSLSSNTERENKPKSFRPVYEHIPSGELVMEFKETVNYGERDKIPEIILKFEDSTDCSIEDKVGEIFVSLCKLSNEAKITNIIKEREKELESQEKILLVEAEEEKKRQLEIIEEKRKKKEQLIKNIDIHMENWFKDQRLNKYADELENFIATIEQLLLMK